MDIGIISVRYAKALLQFAVENKEEQAVYGEMQTLGETFRAVPALQQALINPTYTEEQKTGWLLTAASGDARATLSLRRFVSLVVKNGRADMMLFISASYLTLYRKKKHLTEARLTFARQVNATLVERIRKMLEEKIHAKVEMSVSEDKELLGGFVLEYDTYRLDASVRTQLNELRRNWVQ